MDAKKMPWVSCQKMPGEIFLRKQKQIPGNNMGVINEMWK